MTISHEQTPGPGSASPPQGSIPTTWNGIPILPDAFSAAPGVGKFMYTTHSTIDVIQNYYEQTMPKLGWQKMETAVGQDGGVQLMYYKDGRTASILLTQEGETVIVMLGYE
ncbi:MAG: hypothetical protein H6Q37_467 [Chloroflexi bacterium]|nr:hypothetical protein [Chloroflexota bacterium]